MSPPLGPSVRADDHVSGEPLGERGPDARRAPPRSCGRSLRGRHHRCAWAPRYRARVLAYVVAIVVAIIVIPVTNGSITRLAEVRFRRVWLLVLGLALQVVVTVVDLPRARYEDLGAGSLLASYVALLGFCASNLRTRGIELIGLGIALNAIVIAFNLGMPYKVADGIPRETTVKHRPTRSSDVAVFLSDQIVI